MAVLMVLSVCFGWPQMAFSNGSTGENPHIPNSNLSKTGTTVCLDNTFTLPFADPCLSTNQRTWTGALSTDWNTDGNWNPACVPTSNEHVLIPDAANDPVIGSTVAAVAKSVWVQTNGSLTIQSGGSLDIEGFAPPSMQSADQSYSLLNKGSLQNNGDLTIGAVNAVGAYGIYNTASFENNGTGQISIDRTNTRAVVNHGTFTNAASLTIGALGSVGWYGIENFATFLNNSGGNISINRTSTSAIENNLPGTFTNFATLNIGDLAAAGQSGIVNRATFNNFAGGDISIDRTISFAIHNGTGIFTNTAIITIGAQQAVGNYGIYNGDTFNNNTGGDISIDRVGGQGIWNQSGTFTNAAELTIGGTVGVGNFGIFNLGTFNNHSPGGDIRIDNTNLLGLNNSGIFNNAGDLTIGGTASVGGVGLVNQATFNNNPDGNIRIDRSTEIGISNFSGAFNNAAILTIGGVADVGQYGISNAATFNNNPGGNVSIDNASLAGLRASAGNFTNEATMTIGALAPVGNQGIWNLNSSTFQNAGCNALLNIVADAIILNNSTFENNAGTIIENASGNSSISSNTGTVQNLNGGTFTVGSGNAPINAAGTIWSGCVNSNWNTAANWHNGQVPTANDHVLIPDVTNDPVIGSTVAAVAKSVWVQTNGSLTIQSGGSLDIEGFAPGNVETGNETFSLLNLGAVENSGDLTIGATNDAGYHGIFSRSIIQNNAGGHIRIDRSSFSAITSYGTFTNSATLSIGVQASVGTYGISNEDNFQNNAGGNITIERCISGVGNFNGSAFTNSATLTIGAQTEVPQGIQNNGTFLNNIGGNISIDRSTYIAVYNASGSFNNLSTLNIGAQETAGFHGIYNTATFENNTGGSISIDRSSNSAIYNYTGTFTNSANLTIGELASIGLYGIDNRANFQNNTGGNISIDRSSNYAIYNFNGTFSNSATLTIGSQQAVGWYGIDNRATFQNNTGGNISIDRSSDRAIGNNGNFINSGILTCGELAPIGWRGLWNGNYFQNSSTGQIRIDRSSEWALANTYLSSFINEGSITIGELANVGMYGIYDRGNFQNKACGEITMFAPLSHTDLSFFNTGLITAITTGSHNVTVPIINNGIFAYPLGNPIPNVTNNDLIVAPVTGCASGFNPALTIGGSNSFTAGSTWYSDADLTMPAGAYDQATNTFTPSVGAGTHTLYFSADGMPSCPRTVAISVTVEALPVADAGPAQTICPASTTLAANNPAPGNGEWAIVSGDGNGYFDGNPANTTSGNPQASFHGTLGQTYTLSWTVDNNNSCPTATDEVEITFISPVLSIEVSPASVSENGGQSLDFTFSRECTLNAITVNFDVSGSADFSTDYTQTGAATFSGTSGTVSMDAGQSSVTVTIEPTPDATVELDETVVLTLSAGNGYTLGANNESTGTILNDDEAVLTISSPSITEGDAGAVSLSFEINMNNPADAAVSFDFSTLDGTATTADGDYETTNGTHTLSPGETSKTVEVTVYGDCAIEANEQFTLRLSNLSGSGRAVSFSGSGSTLDGQGTIVNDDALPVITCPGGFSQNTDAGECSAVVTIPLPTVGATCGASNLNFRHRAVGGSWSAWTVSTSNVQTFAAGTHDVEWRLEDGAGSVSCSFSFSVTDNEAPTVTCPTQADISVNSNCQAAIPDFTGASVSDNCGISGVTQNPAAGTLVGVGPQTVSLTVTDVNGNQNTSCSVTFNVIKTGDPDLLWAYTAIGFEEVKMKQNTVQSGGVGVVNAGKKAKLESGTMVTATNTFVKAPELDLNGGSQVGTYHQGPVAASLLPTFQAYSGTCSNNLNIPDNSGPIDLDLACYRDIKVGKNVSVTFVGHGTVNVRDLKLKEGASVSFTQNTNVLIDQKLDADKNVTVSNGGNQVWIFTGDHVKVDDGSSVTANIYSQKHLKVEKTSSGNPTWMTGLFIAEKIDSKDNVFWNWDANTCPFSPPTLMQAGILQFNAVGQTKGGIARVDLSWLTNEDAQNEFYEVEKTLDGVTFQPVLEQVSRYSDDQVRGYQILDPNPAEGDWHYRLKVTRKDGTTAYSETKRVIIELPGDFTIFPNPASDRLNLALRGQEGKPALMQIINSQGVVLEQREIESLPEDPVSFDLHDYRDGMYFLNVRVEGKRSRTLKFVVVKNARQVINKR